MTHTPSKSNAAGSSGAVTVLAGVVGGGGSPAAAGRERRATPDGDSRAREAVGDDSSRTPPDSDSHAREGAPSGRRGFPATRTEFVRRIRQLRARAHAARVKRALVDVLATLALFEGADGLVRISIDALADERAVELRYARDALVALFRAGFVIALSAPFETCTAWQLVATDGDPDPVERDAP